MFCPNCKTEYRPGFTKCADCGIALVNRLPKDAPAGDADAPKDSEGFELLWSGLSPGPYGDIRDALDAEGIVHKDVDKEFGVLPSFSQDADFIWINPRDRAAARAIVAEVLARREDTTDETEQLARDATRVNPLGVNRQVYNTASERYSADSNHAAPPESGAPDQPTPDDIVENFKPEDATTEVWAGEDSDMAQVLEDCLRGVGIGCVASQLGGKVRVLVLPGAEKRAREVIREIVEQSPPR